MKGTLYVIATPIGNLKDITLRALENLKEVDLVACEDTRITGRLLHHYKVKTSMISYHQYSKIEKIDWLIKKLKEGQNIALVTDSGTPGISDPGSVLVKKAINAKIEVIPIPGPSALTAALSASGLVSKGIVFLGFLPKKKGRQKKFKEILAFINQGLIIVFYESPYRIKKTLVDINLLPDNTEVIVFREISKKFEETVYLKTPINKNQIENIKEKGEFTILLTQNRISNKKSEISNEISNT